MAIKVVASKISSLNLQRTISIVPVRPLLYRGKTKEQPALYALACMHSNDGRDVHLCYRVSCRLLSDTYVYICTYVPHTVDTYRRTYSPQYTRWCIQDDRKFRSHSRDPHLRENIRATEHCLEIISLLHLGGIAKLFLRNDRWQC